METIFNERTVCHFFLFGNKERVLSNTRTIVKAWSQFYRSNVFWMKQVGPKESYELARNRSDQNWSHPLIWFIFCLPQFYSRCFWNYPLLLLQHKQKLSNKQTPIRPSPQILRVYFGSLLPQIKVLFVVHRGGLWRHARSCGSIAYSGPREHALERSQKIYGSASLWWQERGQTTTFLDLYRHRAFYAVTQWTWLLSPPCSFVSSQKHVQDMKPQREGIDQGRGGRRKIYCPLVCTSRVCALFIHAKSGISNKYKCSG